MTIKAVYMFLPVLIFFTKKDFFKKDGKTFGFLVFIKNKNRKDKGLIIHEIIHVKQFYRTFGLHIFLYEISSRYRYYAELEAYSAQIIRYGYSYKNEEIIYFFANIIKNGYNLKVSIGKIIKDLTEMVMNG